MRKKPTKKRAFDPFGQGVHPVARVAFRDALLGGIQGLIEDDILWIGLPLADLTKPCPVSSPKAGGKSSSYMLASSGPFKGIELGNLPECLVGRAIRVNAVVVTSTNPHNTDDMRPTSVTI